MNFRSNIAIAGFLLSIALIVAGLTLALKREAEPEWMKWRRKGKALAVSLLEERITQAKDGSLRADLLKEMDDLKREPLDIIEIRPFGGKLQTERCLTCHLGIEDISKSHPNDVFGCVVCHGGVGAELTVEGAHRGLRGGGNPATLDLAQISCAAGNDIIGSCHGNKENALLNRAKNAPTSLMATNAGIIGILRFQWGIEDDSDSSFATRAITAKNKTLERIPEEFGHKGELHLANSHFRKFCASCHLWTGEYREMNGRLAGCPACHAPYEKGGKYRGGDPTIDRNETGHPATHTLTNAIPDERCRACHNRSARIGLNYHGQMESAQYGTPLERGRLKDPDLSDHRYALDLIPDIHFEKGMGCIDCHTGQDTMGDGILHSHMEDQIEIRCEDCHGTHKNRPRTMKVKGNNELVNTLVRSSRFLDVKEGDEILLTSKNRPMPHVKVKGAKIELTSKVTGKKHPVTVITGKKNAHLIKGHERLECDSCHSAWTPQCYGCHQLLDLGHQAVDRIADKKTQGGWAEGRSYFRFERNVYGINSRGKIGLLVPGCQVWNTVIDKQGNVIEPYDSKIMKLRNSMTSIAAGPIHPHTTRTEVPNCAYCHLDPKAMGLGEGRFAHRQGKGLCVEGIFDSRESGLKIDHPLEAFVNSSGQPLQSTSHKLARPFNRKELGRILGVASCIPCHDKYNDPVWQGPGPYERAPSCEKALETYGEGDL